MSTVVVTPSGESAEGQVIMTSSGVPVCGINDDIKSSTTPIAQQSPVVSAATMNINAAHGTTVDDSKPPTGPGYCLFTYNLPSEMDEDDVTKLYTPFGIPTGVKVMRDSATGVSRGFGFVNFATLEESNAAIAALNGLELSGRKLKVSFKKTKETLAAEFNECLFVYNLPSEYDEDGMKKMFEPYGEPTGIKLMRDSNSGRSRGFGFLSMSTRAESEAAINALNGTEIDGRKLKVAFKKAKNFGHHSPWQHSGPPDMSAQFTQHYGSAHIPAPMYAPPMYSPVPMGSTSYGYAPPASPYAAYAPSSSSSSSIPPHMATHQSYPAMQQSPQIAPPHAAITRQTQQASPTLSSVSSLITASSNTPRGSAGVGYGPIRTERAPQAARSNPLSRPSDAQGDAAGAYNPASGYCLFTYNLPSEVDEDGIAQIYAPYGHATGIKLMRDATGRTRGFAFANLPTLEQANAAIAGLSGSQINGRVLKVSFKRAKGAPSAPTFGASASYAYGSTASLPNASSAYAYASSPASAAMQQNIYAGTGSSLYSTGAPGGGADSIEQCSAKYQRALQQYQSLQQSGGETSQAYALAMQAYQVYQVAFNKQQGGGTV